MKIDKNLLKPLSLEKFEKILALLLKLKPRRLFESEIQRDMLIIFLRKKGIEPKKIANQLKVSIKIVKEVISDYPWHKSINYE